MHIYQHHKAGPNYQRGKDKVIVTAQSSNSRIIKMGMTKKNWALTALWSHPAFEKDKLIITTQSSNSRIIKMANKNWASEHTFLFPVVFVWTPWYVLSLYPLCCRGWVLEFSSSQQLLWSKYHKGTFCTWKNQMLDSLYSHFIYESTKCMMHILWGCTTVWQEFQSIHNENNASCLRKEFI